MHEENPIKCMGHVRRGRIEKIIKNFISKVYVNINIIKILDREI